jgi:hypothetical protein
VSDSCRARFSHHFWQGQGQAVGVRRRGEAGRYELPSGHDDSPIDGVQQIRPGFGNVRVAPGLSQGAQPLDRPRSKSNTMTKSFETASSVR